MASEEDFDRKRPPQWADSVSQGRANIRPRPFDDNIVEQLMLASPSLMAITGNPMELKERGGVYGPYEQVTAACGMVAGARLLEMTGVTQAVPINVFQGLHGPRKQLYDVLYMMLENDPQQALLTPAERKDATLDALLEFDRVCAHEIVDKNGMIANAILDGMRHLHKPMRTIDTVTSPTR